MYDIRYAEYSAKCMLPRVCYSWYARVCSLVASGWQDKFSVLLLVLSDVTRLHDHFISVFAGLMSI